MIEILIYIILELIFFIIFSSEKKEIDLNTRNLKHDMKNHLICIYECLEQENLNYAKKYVGNLLNNSDYFKASHSIKSGNIVIDALLNHKNTVMIQLQIKHVSIQSLNKVRYVVG